MQDLLLVCCMIANLRHAGYFADLAKLARPTLKQLSRQVCAVVAGFRNWQGVPAGTARPLGPSEGVPSVCTEFQYWMARLARMESYVLSMR
jgi:hypothetical protein